MNDTWTFWLVHCMGIRQARLSRCKPNYHHTRRLTAARGDPSERGGWGEIDRLVRALYGLTVEEIAAVEAR